MGRKSNWKSGETVAIRVPKALESQVMAYARALDAGSDTGRIDEGIGQKVEGDRPVAPHQVLSPLNPLSVRFFSKGNPVEGLAVGVLVDWGSRKVKAVLINHENGQTQLPLDSVEFLSPISYEKPPELFEALAGLVERHRQKHEGHPDKTRLLRYSPDKYLNYLGSSYNHIQFHLTGHQTNPTNSGIFAKCRDEAERDLILWMILAEVLEGLTRSSGGSVHWGMSECREPIEQSA